MNHFMQCVGTIGPFDIVSYQRDDQLYGLRDKSGKLIIRPEVGFRSYTHYEDGILIASHPDKHWVLLDYNGNQCSDTYDYIEYAEEGYYRVSKGSRSNIMDRSGKLVLAEWPHSVSNVHNGYFSMSITKRKTATTPTKYLSGVAHVSGIIVFPYIFDSIHPTENVWVCRYHKELYYVYDGAIFDPLQRNMPKIEASFNPDKLLQDTLDWIFQNIGFYYRDSDTEIDIDQHYKVGDILRSGFYCNTSSLLQKPATKTRFFIASAHGAPVYYGDNSLDDYKYPHAVEWKQVYFHKNAWFQVMDIYHYEGYTQVLLLQVPYSYVTILRPSDYIDLNDVTINNDQTIIDIAHQDFEEKVNSTIHPRSKDVEFSKLMYQPLGYTSDGERYTTLPDLSGMDGQEKILSNTIHNLSNDCDITEDIDGFPWYGIVGSVCEGCIYAPATKNKPFGCGRLFKESFREKYFNQSCEFYKWDLIVDSSFEYRKRQQQLLSLKQDGTYAHTLLVQFITQKLNGDINKIADFDFRTLNTDQTFGPLKGSAKIENYAIIKAIAEICFGEYWPNLDVSTLDSYQYQIGHLINYQNLCGVRVSDRVFKVLDEYHFDNYYINLAEDLHKICGSIGNFVVWPNKAPLYNSHENSKLRGYPDRLFIEINKVMSDLPHKTPDIQGSLYKNRKLMVNYKGHDGFVRFMQDSMLSDFLDENGNPLSLFEGVYCNAKDFTPIGLPHAIQQYHDIMIQVVKTRTSQIIDKLKQKLG